MRTSDVGSKKISPVSPSNTTLLSKSVSIFEISKFITQGIPKFLATITACDVGPALDTTKPFTFVRSMDEVSFGVKSSAKIITSSVKFLSVTISCIVKMISLPIEIMSSALCLKYSSSKLSI